MFPDSSREEGVLPVIGLAEINNQENLKDLVKLEPFKIMILFIMILE